jgi:uncharacterized protein (TIGR01777 family)
VSTVLISGASGFIGSHLARSLAADGHRVVPLSRSAKSGAVAWDAEAGTLDEAALARAQPDVVVNLAGEPIAQRWTPKRSLRIYESRVNGTTALVAALTKLATRPTVLVNGSAIGYYGAHRGDELLDESSSAGTDFLAETTRDWERATAPAADAGIRVALSRTGLVIGAGGGLLDQLLMPFRLGVGGRVGSGQQWMSWIAMDDMVRALRFLIDTPSLSGPVNMVAPNPVRNAEFTRALADALHRPAVLPVPRSVLELVFGTMADNTILASQRVAPRHLAGAGFEFRHPQIGDALRAALTRSDG